MSYETFLGAALTPEEKERAAFIASEIGDFPVSGRGNKAPEILAALIVRIETLEDRFNIKR